MTGVAFLTIHYKDTMDNLILLTDFTLRKGQFLENTIKFWTKFDFGNVQSLKNLLRDYLVKEKIGLFLATETWLKY